MRKVFSCFLLLAASVTLFLSCSSDNDETQPDVEVIRPGVEAPSASAEEVKAEVGNIIKALKEINGELNGADLNSFIASLEESEIKASTNEFTVFAVEDENPTVIEEPKSQLNNSVGERKFNMNYHILAGKVDVKHISVDKDYVYKTINGNEVKISKRNNVVYVNGVAMKKNDFFGNKHGKGSHIYCIKDEVPAEQVSINSETHKNGAYDIRVMNIVNGKLAPSKDAIVIAFEQIGEYQQRLISKVRTNDDGYATVFYNGKNNVIYKAANQEYSYIYAGFLIDGVYTSNNIKNALVYENVKINGVDYKPEVGGIILADMNADGKISYLDRAGKKFQRLDKEAELNTIHLASKRK